MRCEDVQNQLAIGAQPAQLSGSVRVHLSECSNCRRVQSLYLGIERELCEKPAWQPPPDFVERVALKGLASLGQSSVKPQFISWAILRTGVAPLLLSYLLGALFAALSWLALSNRSALVVVCTQFVVALHRCLIANPIPLAWIAAFLSLWLSAWLVRRVHR